MKSWKVGFGHRLVDCYDTVFKAVINVADKAKDLQLKIFSAAI